MITIDTNAYLGRWPFRRLPCDETPRLLERLDRHGVTQAWVGSLEGVFHRDLGGVNLRLADECRQHAGRLVPFGSVNPKLPDWQEDVRRCADQCGTCRASGCIPTTTGTPWPIRYSPRFSEAADERGLIVQLVVRMDDPRVQHPLVPVRQRGTRAAGRRAQALPQAAIGGPERRGAAPQRGPEQARLRRPGLVRLCHAGRPGLRRAAAEVRAPHAGRLRLAPAAVRDGIGRAEIEGIGASPGAGNGDPPRQCPTPAARHERIGRRRSGTIRNRRLRHSAHVFLKPCEFDCLTSANGGR